MSDTNTEKKKTVRVGIWLKESGNLMNKATGLTPEEVEFFHSLKVGDRIIAFDNNPKEEKYPKYNLTKYLGPAGAKATSNAGNSSEF